MPLAIGWKNGTPIDLILAMLFGLRAHEWSHPPLICSLVAETLIPPAPGINRAFSLTMATSAVRGVLDISRAQGRGGRLLFQRRRPTP